jgi:O-antigen/teichoic acid export membrane protein
LSKRSLFSYLRISFVTGATKTTLVTLSTLIFLPLIIKEIGMDNYGLISMAMIFSSVHVFADFGIAKTVTLLLGQGKEDGKAIISSAVIINLFILSIIGGAIGLLLLFDINFFGNNTEISQYIQNEILIVGFILLTLTQMNNFLSAILEAKLQMHYVNIGYMISSISLNATIYLFSILFESVPIILIAPIFSFSLVTIYLFIIIIIKTDTSIGKPTYNEFQKILKVAYGFLSLGIINAILIPTNKYFIVFITGSSTVMGVFDVSLKIAMMANSFLNSIAQPLFGVFARMKGEKKQIYTVARKVSLVLLSFYCIGCIIFYFTGESISKIIDIENHKHIYTATMVLIIGVSFSSVSEPFYRAMLTTGKLKPAFFMKMSALAVNFLVFICMRYVDYPYSTIITIAYASAILFSSLTIITYNLLKHRHF